MKEFLASGRFGLLELGMPRERIKEILGPPDTFGGLSRRHEKAGAGSYKAGIWLYGCFQLLFDVPPRGPDQGLEGVFADHFDELQGGDRLQLDAWILRGSLRRGLLEEELAREGIAYRLAPWKWEPEMDALTTAGGVTLLFGEYSDDAYHEWAPASALDPRKRTLKVIQYERRRPTA